MTYVDAHGNINGGKIVFHIVGFLVGLLSLALWGCPQYNVWEQTLAGEAEFKRAEQNR